MLALRVNGSRPINRLRGEMDRLFDSALTGFPRFTRDAWFAPTAPTFPAVNVWEDRDNLYVEAELPGLQLDDIELLVMGDELTIKGERKEVCEDGVSCHRKERGGGSFGRVFRLPVGVDAEKVEAMLCDGVLTVTMPKAEKAKPRKINVTVKALPK